MIEGHFYFTLTNYILDVRLNIRVVGARTKFFRDPRCVNHCRILGSRQLGFLLGDANASYGRILPSWKSLGRQSAGRAEESPQTFCAWSRQTYIVRNRQGR